MHNIYEKNYINYLKTGKNIIFRADLHLIAGCNFRCIMCDNWKKKIEINFEFRDLQKYILILKKVYNCNYVRFHGQEPTLYDKLEDIIVFTKKIKIKVAIKTNGWLITDKKLIKIVKSGLDELYLSVDGPSSKIHDKIRGIKGSFDKNIDLIIKSKKINPDLKIYLNSVVMNENFSYLDKMIDLGKKYNIDRISFVFLNDKNKKNINNINLSKKDFFSFFETTIVNIYKKSSKLGIQVDFSPFISSLSGKGNSHIISELKNNFNLYKKEILAFYNGEYGKFFYDKYGCFGPLDHSSINYNGDMYGCCVVERKREVSIGNIIKDDLKVLWNSQKYRLYRAKSNYACSYSKKCSSNFYTRKNLFKNIYLNDDLYPKNIPFNYYRYLKELQYENDKLLNLIKTKKLKNILIHFYKKLDFYKKLLEKNNIFLNDLEQIKDLSIISKLPTLDKDILIKNYDEIKKIDLKNSIIAQTSGTSGKRLTFFYPLDFRRYIKQIAIFSEESNFIFGDAYFSLTPDNCNQMILDNIETPYYVKNTQIQTPLDFDFGDAYFYLLKDFFKKYKDIKFLHSDPKYLLYIILGFRKYNIPLPKLDFILLTYSYANKNLKKYIKKSFSCEIFDNYGSSEVGPISLDKNGKKEIFGDNIIIESINLKIITSDLDNYSFPFIKYFNGDLGKINGKQIFIFGREGENFMGKNLKEIDDFFYENFSEIISYQFLNDNLLYISDKTIDNRKLNTSISTFFKKNIKALRLKDSFFSLNNFSKFKFIC